MKAVFHLLIVFWLIFPRSLIAQERLQQLISTLTSAKWPVKCRIARQLGHLGEQAAPAVPALIPLINAKQIALLHCHGFRSYGAVGSRYNTNADRCSTGTTTETLPSPRRCGNRLLWQCLDAGQQGIHLWQSLAAGDGGRFGKNGQTGNRTYAT